MVVVDGGNRLAKGGTTAANQTDAIRRTAGLRVGCRAREARVVAVLAYDTCQPLLTWSI